MSSKLGSGSPIPYSVINPHTLLESIRVVTVGAKIRTHPICGLSPRVSVPDCFRIFPEFDGLASHRVKLDGYIMNLMDETSDPMETFTLFSPSSNCLNLIGSHLLLTSTLYRQVLLPCVSVIEYWQMLSLLPRILQMSRVFHRSKFVLYQHTPLQDD